MLAWCCCWRDWWWARLTTGPHTTDSPRGQSAGPSLSPPASRSSSPAEPGCLCWARGSRAMLRGAESALLPLSLRSVALMGRRTGEVLTRHLPTITRQSSSAGTPVSWSWSPAGSTGTSGWWVPGPALRTVPGSSWGCTLAGVSLGPVTRDTVTTTSSDAAGRPPVSGSQQGRSGRAVRRGQSLEKAMAGIVIRFINPQGRQVFCFRGGEALEVRNTKIWKIISRSTINNSLGFTKVKCKIIFSFL